jgi:hypothetical protein
MTEPNLLVICIFAFIAVFLLLTLLAGVMRAMTALFPHREDGPDAVLAAAITAAAATAYPGTRVTHIEENR